MQQRIKNFFWNRWIIPTLTLSLLITACNQDYVPKPRSYFRIDLPEKSWQKFDTNFPYTFEYPSYSQIHFQNNTSGNPYWINIDFPKFKGTCYISFSDPGTKLKEYLEESREMAMKHMQKSNGIDEFIINRPDERVFGTVFEISGTDAASTYQFYLTDSLHNFIRGALYFNIVPNNDSLSPVIAFLKKDVDHLIETFQWRNVRNQKDK